MPSEKTYLGEVVDNKDPLYQGRARIKVFGVLDDIPTEDLPWAEQVAGLSFGGGYGGGNLSIPRIGSVVTVHFEEGNYYKMNFQAVKEISPDLIDELKKDNSYDGAQSLIYDSEADPGTLKIIYTKAKGLLLQLGDASVNLDTQNGKELRVVIKMGDDEIRMEQKKVIVNSKHIELGEGAAESLILGDTFQTYFNQHTHIGNLGAPTSPPVVPSTPNHLSTISKTKFS